MGTLTIEHFKRNMCIKMHQKAVCSFHDAVRVRWRVGRARGSVVLGPGRRLAEVVDDLLHGQVGDELVLREFRPRYRVKVTHPLFGIDRA